METVRSRLLCSGTALVCVGIAVGALQAQPIGTNTKRPANSTAAAAKGGAQSGAKSRPAGERRGPTTLVFFDLITGNDELGLKAHRWMEILQKLDVTVTIRRATPRDKPGVTEKKSGSSVRQVSVVGRLDSKGQLVFEDRFFTEAEVDKLARWIESLREFGAQGTPEAQPAWGLSKQQLTELLDALRVPLTVDLKGRDFNDALEQFRFPAEYPLRMSESATKTLHERGEKTARESLQGLSKGTALAALLSDWGLGFRPQRLPNGSIELTVERSSEMKKAWPIGWAPTQGGPAIAPKLYTSTPINLDNIELDAVLDAAVDFIGVPILVDTASLEPKNIDFSQVKVSHLPKKTTWGLALRNLLSQAKARWELLIDEAGQPFIWVTHATVPPRTKSE
jgi:hypothetical protein